MNNITVDGSSFNNSFGLGGQPGDRTGVAPISLEAIEQIQVNVAPVRRAPGQLHRRRREHGHPQRHQPDRAASFYHRFRDQDWVGTEAAGQAVNPGTFTFRNTGGWASGPIIKNRWFAFGNYEDEIDTRPLTTFRANQGGEPVGGYGHARAGVGPDRAQQLPQARTSTTTPARSTTSTSRRRPSGSCCAATTTSTTRNKVSFRYNHLELVHRRRPVGLRRRRCRGRNINSTGFLGLPELQLPDSREHPVGHRRVEQRHRQQHGQLVPDRLHLPGREPRLARRRCSRSSTSSRAAAPTRRSASSRSPSTTSCATRRSSSRTTSRSSPRQHTFTFGGYTEKYHSDNVFFGCCPQGAYVYNSLADFYADANGFLANPNRTVAPVTLRALPGALEQHPRTARSREQPLDVWYSAGYVQDEWRPRSQPDGHRRRALRRVAVQEHRLRQPGRRRADVP